MYEQCEIDLFIKWIEQYSLHNNNYQLHYSVVLISILLSIYSSILYFEPILDNKVQILPSSSSSSLSSLSSAWKYSVYAQVSSHISNLDHVLNYNSTIIQQDNTSIVKASGHFANNQIQDNIVAWIQGGMWSLDIKDSENKNDNSSNMTAYFDANFTMIKPDGSLSHNHIINNFKSENVIFAGNDIVITGVADIHSDSAIEFNQVPITVHLMGKKVLGLMIDVNKTGGHFSGENEMFGTLISGMGLEGSDTDGDSNSNNLTNNETPLYTNSTSQPYSLNHSMH